MAVGRDTDAATWLHNKLGSTDDLWSHWSGSSICSQLTQYTGLLSQSPASCEGQTHAVISPPPKEKCRRGWLHNTAK